MRFSRARAWCAPFIGLALLAAARPGSAEPRVSIFTRSVSSPVRVTAPPGDDRVFVVEQNGLIRVFNRGGSSRGVYLDLTSVTVLSGERGLLGLAFAPDYRTSGRFYVNYTDLAGDTRIARYRVSADPDRADAAHPEIILTVTQPYSNHNGGHLAFGPDGKLYIGLGDGGNGGDPQNNGQNPQSLLGKMLRLDVSPASGYGIPPDNPFVSSAPRDEIWALGLRNPWCYAFDAVTGDLWIADVGQDRLEEIDTQPAASRGGENYGWRLMEGGDCYNPPSACNDGSLTLPIHTYTHGGAPSRCSISGGGVYRGAAVPALQGAYLFADYCSDQVWSLVRQGGSVTVTERTAQLTPAGGFGNIVSFGTDGHDEMYVVDRGGNAIYRLVDSVVGNDAPPPAPALEPNVPNPFNPRTEIAFSLPMDGPVRLDVYDAVGRQVHTLVDGFRSAGRHVVSWNGADDAGRPAPAGVYLYRLEQGATVITRKMTLLE